MSKPEIAPESRQSVPATNPHSRGTDTTNVEPRASQVAKREGLGGRVLASSEARQVSSRFLSLICKNNPGSQLAMGTQRLRNDAVERWALTFDKINGLRGWDWPKIRRVAAFTQRDPFWRGRVRGADNLLESIMNNPRFGDSLEVYKQVHVNTGVKNVTGRARHACSACGEIGHVARGGRCSTTSVAVAMAADPTYTQRDIASALGCAQSNVSDAMARRGIKSERKAGRLKGDRQTCSGCGALGHVGDGDGGCSKSWRAVQMFHAGEHVIDIAGRLGISSPTVYRAIKAHGLPGRRRRAA